MDELVKASGVAISDSYGLRFAKPAKAFYITSPAWDRRRSTPPFEISSDIGFVAKGALYVPIFFDQLYSALEILSRGGATNFTYKDGLTEPIDFDPSDSSSANFTYLMHNGFLFRIRNDASKIRKYENTAHTMMILGNSEKSLADIANDLDLPHPFDKSLYPYRKDFINNRELPLTILS